MQVYLFNKEHNKISIYRWKKFYEIIDIYVIVTMNS